MSIQEDEAHLRELLQAAENIFVEKLTAIELKYEIDGFRMNRISKNYVQIAQGIYEGERSELLEEAAVHVPGVIERLRKFYEMRRSHDEETFLRQVKAEKRNDILSSSLGNAISFWQREMSVPDAGYDLVMHGRGRITALQERIDAIRHSEPKE